MAHNKLLNCLSKGTGYYEVIPKTIADANEGVQVSVIKSHAEPLLKLSMTKIISDVCEFHGANWSGQVIVRLIDYVVESYWHLKIEEIAMVWNRAQKVYGALKPADLMNWLNDYDNGERIKYFEALNSRHKDGYEKQFIETERKEAARDKKELDENIRREHFRELAKTIVKG